MIFLTISLDFYIFLAIFECLETLNMKVYAFLMHFPIVLDHIDYTKKE